MHIVRNHGAVPRIKWSEHRLEINGLVNKPMILTMDEIVSLPSVTIPVTVVCAGNRRKEENMVKKSIGFNWGPCAAGTTYWTGVRLRDLLLHCGVKVRYSSALLRIHACKKMQFPRLLLGIGSTKFKYSCPPQLLSMRTPASSHKPPPVLRSNALLG